MYLENAKQKEAIELIEKIAEMMTKINELKTQGNITYEDMFENLLLFKEGTYKAKLTAVNLFK